MFNIMNPWLWLGVLVAALSIGGGGFLYGVKTGTNNTQVKWQTREAKITADSAKTLSEANARVRAAERKAAVDLAAASEGYQNKLKEKDVEKNRAVIAARTNGLYVNTTGGKNCGNTTGTTAPTSIGRNGEERRRLSDEASEFLISEATRADKVTEQLSACQNVVRADRQ